MTAYDLLLLVPLLAAICVPWGSLGFMAWQAARVALRAIDSVRPVIIDGHLYDPRSALLDGLARMVAAAVVEVAKVERDPPTSPLPDHEPIPVGDR